MIWLILLMTLYPTYTFAKTDCPRLDLGETQADCPWGGLVRKLQEMPINPAEMEAVVLEETPTLVKNLVQEGKWHSHANGFLPLWGQSLNYDEFMKAEIVDTSILDFLLKKASAPERLGHVVSAGFEHTYGYLFSNLKTAFGYKRARWVRGDLEAGFQLPSGTLSPTSEDGLFFSNVSYFAGKIAFRGQSKELEILESGSGVSSALKAFPFESLCPLRLEETVKSEDGRILKFRTDFVPFSSGAVGGNEEVLVYSIEDTDQYQSVNRGPKLITLFPVTTAFRKAYLDPSLLGDEKHVFSRFNAYVPDFTNNGKLYLGTRYVVR